MDTTNNIQVGILSLSGGKIADGLLEKFRQLRAIEEDNEDIVSVIEPLFIELGARDLDIDHYTAPVSVDVVVLLHSVTEGRFSLTNVLDARYDRLLPCLGRTYGANRVAVVAHSLPNFSDTTKDVQMMMLRSGQPTTFLCSGCVILCGSLSTMHEEDWKQLVKFIKQSPSHPQPSLPAVTAHPSQQSPPTPSSPAVTTSAGKLSSSQLPTSSAIVPTSGYNSTVRDTSTDASGKDSMAGSSVDPDKHPGGQGPIHERQGTNDDIKGAKDPEGYGANKGSVQKKENTMIVALLTSTRPFNKSTRPSVESTTPSDESTTPSDKYSKMTAALKKNLTPITVIDESLENVRKSWKIFKGALYHWEDHYQLLEDLKEHTSRWFTTDSFPAQDHVAALVPASITQSEHAHITSRIFKYEVDHDGTVHFDKATIGDMQHWLEDCSTRTRVSVPKKLPSCEIL